ncbi:acyltransferase/acetyltransferase [Lachnospiraceae bacterium KM106-2]|nr:acyltransferase/acetyltransferase [Lachnospiraceae bacterium KM106-2]
MMNKIKERYDWVDVSRAIALIFVYLGHWVSMNLEAFAYTFHLQLFFIIAGFFAVKQEKKSVRQFISKRIIGITIPFALWAWIGFVLNDSDVKNIGFKQILSIFLEPNHIEPNYWFFPVILSVSIVYYFFKRYFTSSGLICLFSYVIYLFFGEIPVISEKCNVFLKLANLPVLNRINAWFSISGIPQYLFWYALGAFSFEYIVRLVKYSKKNKKTVVRFHITGLVLVFISSMLFFRRLESLYFIRSIIKVTFFFVNIKLIWTLIVCMAVIYMSIVLQESNLLQFIGKHTMALMGLEFITHGYITLHFLPMINLGLPNIDTTVDVVIITIIHLAINLMLVKWICRYTPVLDGKLHTEKV